MQTAAVLSALIFDAAAGAAGKFYFPAQPEPGPFLETTATTGFGTRETSHYQSSMRQMHDEATDQADVSAQRSWRPAELEHGRPAFGSPVLFGSQPGLRSDEGLLDLVHEAELLTLGF